ncbi:MAG: N-acetyltransferase family protein [Fibrella sp.]|nr:N-acetyltransferase family protein [Armatimonadota bacterium]
MPTHPVIIRPVELRDAEPLRAIYNWAVARTTATMGTEPRSPGEQIEWMEKHNGLPYPALVAEDADGGQVVGYASLSCYIPREGYRHTAEVSVYVHCDWHGLGIGSALLSSLLVEADRRGFVSLLALITDDNEPSLRLHRRYGFTDAGILHRVGYKFDTWLDVAILERVSEATN